MVANQFAGCRSALTSADITKIGRLRPSRPSLFRQYERISTQDYRDARKDNSRYKLRDPFYFWWGLLLAWRRHQRWLSEWRR